MRRIDMMRNVLKAYKKVYKNKNYHMRYIKIGDTLYTRIKDNSTHIYYMDVHQFRTPCDIHLNPSPIYNTNGKVVGIAIEHIFWCEKCLGVRNYVERFDIAVPKEFQDQEY